MITVHVPDQVTRAIEEGKLIKFTNKVFMSNRVCDLFEPLAGFTKAVNAPELVYSRTEARGRPLSNSYADNFNPEFGG